MEALRHYLGLHRANFVGAIKRLAGQPFASLLTILVIATALALPAGLRVAVNNADAVSDSWQGAADFTVYLKLDVSEQAARRTAHEIEAREDVAHVTLIDRDAASPSSAPGRDSAKRLMRRRKPAAAHFVGARPARRNRCRSVASRRALPETDLVRRHGLARRLRDARLPAGS
jgi:cell division transport system permease protein